MTESRQYHFVQEAPRLFSTSGFISFPGNSGGPVCVLADSVSNPIFYPAAIYLGSFEGRSIVRTIDSPVANLIARAASLAELGANFTGGGVVNFNAAGGEPFGIQQLTVHLQPDEAVAKGAAWRVVETAGAFITVVEATTDLVSGFDYTIEFKAAPGWITPTNFMIDLPGGQDAELTVNYVPAVPILTSSADGIFVTEPVGKVVEIQFTPIQSEITSWSTVQTISLG
ncbi:MAG: hypothetical protein EXS36_08490 [Pedosphaera sp.]|nr:hypothetical protein [Pedosphaera sp.]